jgi:hypothetical protein
MMRQPWKRQRQAARRVGAAVAMAGWVMLLAVPAMARPGFGVRGGGGSAPAPSAPRASSPSVGAVHGGAGSGLSRSDGSVRFDRSMVRPGFGRNPNYNPGGSGSRGSRDRFFDPGSNAGSYGFRDGRRRVYRPFGRDYYYAAPFYYGTPFYSPFSFGYAPYDGVFSYYDWYTGPYRQYSDPGRYDTGRRDDAEEDRRPLRGPGNLELDIEPRDVEVRIDGVLTTQDGRASIDLPTGTYRLEVTRPGYKPFETEVVVRQGIRYTVETRLEPLPGEEGRRERGPAPRLAGELVLDVTPDDTIATLDGRLLGVVNLLRGSTALRSVLVGRHKLELSRPGYRKVTRDITVDAREPLTVVVRMEKE